MKRDVAGCILALLCAVLLFAGCTVSVDVVEEPAEEQMEAPDELRAVWLSFYELAQPEGGCGETLFRDKYDKLFGEIAAYGLNTVFAHVHPVSDAVYPSALVPWSHILTGQQGRHPGYDPLDILCKLAEEHGLALHAWMNLLRVTDGADTAMLAADNPALAHIEARDGWVCQANGKAWYWNPAVTETQALLLGCVRELLERYPVAGIHLDDYFYPTTAPEFDAPQYAAYRAAGGGLGLADWRRGTVNALVQGLYRTVKAARPDAVFSISPGANSNRNFSEYYADAALWLREPGYADWIIPQIYFGFDHPTLPFEKTAKQWAALPRHSDLKLFAGLPCYKAGKEDAWAGAGGAEFLEHGDIIARQVRCLRAIEGYSGFALYSSGAFFGDSLTDIALRERTNLQKLL